MPVQEKSTRPLWLDALRLCSEAWDVGIPEETLRRYRRGQMRACHLESGDPDQLWAPAICSLVQLGTVSPQLISPCGHPSKETGLEQLFSDWSEVESQCVFDSHFSDSEHEHFFT